MATEQSLASTKKNVAKNQLENLEDGSKLDKSSSPSRNQHHSGDDGKLIVVSHNNQEDSTKVISAATNGDHTKEISEIISFANENRLEIPDILQGARISATLRHYGSEPTQFERFLEAVYTRASEKGHTATEILNQCEKINNLEQKYGASFEKLKIKFEHIGKEVVAKTKEFKTLEHEVTQLQSRRSKLMEQYSMDEKRLKEYSESSEQLTSMGLDIKNLVSLRNCLRALKDERFDPKSIVEKVETIGLLEPRKKALQAEISKQKAQLDQNKSVLNQLRRVHETGLSVDQIERIRHVVAQISSNRGIVPDQAFSLFEQDVLKNYDVTLGLIPEVARLQENRKKILSEIEDKRNELDSKERAHLDKIKKLDEKFIEHKAEIEAYNELRALGVEGSKILKWEKLIVDGRLDFSQIESDLTKLKSLKGVEEQEERKLKELHTAQESLTKSIAHLTSDKRNLEESIRIVKDTALSEVEATKTKILTSISEFNEKARSNLEQIATQIAKESDKALQDMSKSSQQGIAGAMEESKNNLVRAVSEANSSVTNFSGGLKQALKDAEDEIKIVSQTLEAGEKIGKYKALLPLIEIMSNETSKVKEGEALIAMWNVSNRFGMWLSSRYGAQDKKEIADPLATLISAMNEEIQRIDK